MSDAFDPYRKWLGIPPAEQPPHHYRLLGIGLYEDDPDVIESAADQRMAHLRTFQAGPHSALSQKLLNEVVAAKICLLSPKQRAAYDAELRQRLSPPEPAVERPRPVAAPRQPVAVAPVVAATVGQDPLETAMASLAASQSAASQPFATRPRGKPKGGRPLVWWLAGAGGLFILVVAALVISSRPEPPAVVDRGAERPAAKSSKPIEANVVNGTSVAKLSPPKVSPGAIEPQRAIAPFDAKQARAHQEAWAAYLKTPIEQTNSLGMLLVLIPPGEFTMGSTPEQMASAKEFARQSKKTFLEWTLQRIDAEAPAHHVKLSRPFLMGATEVTIGQFRRFVEATSYVTETERFGGGSSTSKEEQDPQKKALNWRGPNYPTDDRSAVVEITWNDAVAFCNWLSEAEKKRRCYQQNEQGHWVLDRTGDGYRLPTEAEWEYVCRAGATTQYAFGDDASSLGQYGWSDKTGPIAFPVAVGSKLPNPFGLYDMHGNVEEWCYDWFAPKFYAESPADDPAGPASGDHRIKRGGTWDGPIVNCRAAFRASYPPFFRFGDLGFRVVCVSTSVAQAAEAAATASMSNDFQKAATTPTSAVAPFDVAQARAHQEAWAAYLKRPVEKSNLIGMPLVLIPPGEFTMGSTPEQIAAAKKIAEEDGGDAKDWTLSRIEAEAPAHRVKISRPFLIGATEVTVAEYRRFVDASRYVTETERFGGGDSVKKDEQDPQKKSATWRGLMTGNDNAAVRQVTWNDAVAFCNWLSDAEKLSRCYRGSEQDGWQLESAGEGYRLPTEAEWEYACRAGTTTQYSFGDEPSAFAQSGWSLKMGPIPNPNSVAGKRSNPFGLYDLHGNVAEWCNDWFPSDYHDQSSQNDPAGPPSGNTKVHRGGAMDSPLAGCRSAFRGNFLATARFWDLGFRVVRLSVAADK